LHLATDRACEALGCDGAVIFVSVDGTNLGTVGSTADMLVREDLFGGQFATPCHDALTTGEPATFAEAVPLRHRDQTIGTLCVMRSSRRYFRSDTVTDARRLADVVTAGIVREHARRAALAVTAQLEHALEARVVVEQAKGMIAAELGTTVADALSLLRGYARSRQRRLADVAADVVNRQLSARDLR
jgi:GAF domain-containing protein